MGVERNRDREARITLAAADTRKVTMKSLIDDILTIETQANEILESHRTQAKELEKQAAAKIQAAQQEVAAQVERRVTAFRAQAVQKHAEQLAKAETVFKQALQSIEGVSERVIDEHAKRIVARFREI